MVAGDRCTVAECSAINVRELRMESDSFSDDEFDDFHNDVMKMQKYYAIFGFLILLGGFLLLVSTVYFFLAAAGIVPALDLVPFIPYI